ncbi:MAG: hypothetical protein ACU84Q_06510 [Gammaproteobacteria bacterium]
MTPICILGACTGIRVWDVIEVLHLLVHIIAIRRDVIPAPGNFTMVMGAKER